MITFLRLAQQDSSDMHEWKAIVQQDITLHGLMIVCRILWHLLCLYCLYWNAACHMTVTQLKALLTLCLAVQKTVTTALEPSSWWRITPAGPEGGCKPPLQLHMQYKISTNPPLT